MSERKRKRRGVSPKTPEGRRVVPEGAFESALLILKRAFPEETMGVGDTEFWQPIEEKASMKPNQACFQYNMIGIGHVKLAQICLDFFYAFRTGVGMGEISKDEKHNLLSRASHFFLREYPPTYREKIEDGTS